MVRYWPVVLMIFLLFLVTSCDKNDSGAGSAGSQPGTKELVQVSEKPPGTSHVAITQARTSDIGLRLRINYEDLATIAANQIPEQQHGDGTKRVCKKVIGVKVCGTAQWIYTVHRTGPVSVSGEKDYVVLGLPLRFDGNAGVKGSLAKSLGLRKLDFSGALDANIKLNFDLGEDWCPRITTQIEYNWTQSPKAEWVGIDIGLKKRLDEALAKQLESLDQKIKDSIDCNEFRGKLQSSWRQYSFPLNLPIEKNTTDTPDSNLYLNLLPESFAFSGMRTEDEKLGVTFSLSAKAAVEPQMNSETEMTLPALQRVKYAPGATEFDLPVRVVYSQLEALAKPGIIGKTFTSKSSAGDISVVVNALEIYGSDEGLTVGLMFDADLPATLSNTPGTIYLTTQPEIDTFNRQLRLTNTSLSKVIDSTLWSILASVFETKIIKSIEEKAVIDLGEKIDDLRDRLEAQISDPARTGGLVVTAEHLNVNLTELIPENEALVIVVRATAKIDINVPASILVKE